jgi:DNA polymerase
MNSTKKLKAIHQKWFENCVCKLKKTATQPVPGVGNPDSMIVFIGEAPGKDEDIQGKPFVGRAGKFLEEMLEAIKMNREDIYITNTVKYRPPDNRDPLPDEIRDCLPWLIEEINSIKPKLIIPLGRHAMNRFFPEAKISEVHGKLLKRKLTFKMSDGSTLVFPTEHFFPLYHPAAALYNGSMRETLIEDFKKIPRVLKNIQKKKTS